MGLDSSLTVAVASFLLSLAGITSVSGGNFIFIPSAGRSLQVQIGILDWMGFFLWDIFYVFAIWTFVTLRGGQFSSRRYLVLGASGLLIMFLGNSLKVFAEIYTAVSSGALSGATDASTIDAMDVTGFAAMFGFVLVLVASTCLLISRIKPKSDGWPGLSSP